MVLGLYPLRAEKLKKVLILDFKNLDKNPNYQYLEDSVTEAIRTNLKAKFDFKEMPKADWQSIAQKNYFLWPEENFNRGFALNLGLLARQDIAVGGYYQAVIADKGKHRGSFVIKAHVFVLDIGKKKIVTEFDMEMPADASLFTAVEDLAARVVKEAQAVLPNKGEGGIQRDDDELGRHEVGLIAGTSVVSVPAAFSGNYAGTTALYAKDFSTPIAVSAYYAYHDFLYPHVQLQVLGGARFGSQNLAVASDTKKIRASLTDIFAGGYIGYEFVLWRFTLTPLMGAGFSLASVKLDYTTLTSQPVNAQGSSLTESSLNISAPFAEAALRLGFKLTPRLSLELYGGYRQSIYIGQSMGEVLTMGGFGYRL